jgi:Domain of unknown function (DUF5664)
MPCSYDQMMIPTYNSRERGGERVSSCGPENKEHQWGETTCLRCGLRKVDTPYGKERVEEVRGWLHGQLPKPLDAEERVTDPVTGGQKGRKLAQFGALDPKALLEVAKAAGFGAMKYERFNFLRGFDWGLAYDAAQRHLHAFWSGEESDPDSGMHHLAHAGWHVLALLAFSLRGRGTDDRPHRFIEGLAKAPRTPKDELPGAQASPASLEPLDELGRASRSRR